MSGASEGTTRDRHGSATPTQLEVLEFVRTYGRVWWVGGAIASVRAAGGGLWIWKLHADTVEACLRRGWLRLDDNHLHITDAGRQAVTP